MSLYNAINGVNPATFMFLPMLGKHPDEYPRFRDCFIGEDENSIIVYTRVGGGNRNCGFNEEELYKHPNFIKTYDDVYDDTYGYYVFSIPNEWVNDFTAILNGELWSKEYHNQMCKVFPKLKDKFTELYNKKKELWLKKFEGMATKKAKRLRRGKYLYRGYIVTCVGYYPPEHKVAWEAEDENGNGFAHSFSLRDTKRLIDESLDK